MPSIGAVLHTINIRLPREQIVYIINHAEDRLIFLDKSLAGPIAEMQRELPAVEKYIFMDDRGPEPAAISRPSLDYEELLADASERADISRAGRKDGRGALLHLGNDR